MKSAVAIFSFLQTQYYFFPVTQKVTGKKCPYSEISNLTQERKEGALFLNTSCMHSTLVVKL